MNKYMKILAAIGVTILLFCFGHRIFLQLDAEKIRREPETSDLMEQQELVDANPIEEEKDGEKQTEQKQTEQKETEEKAKTEKTVKTAGSGGWIEKEETWDQEFEELLEEHVFGDWRFSRRIGVKDDGVYAPGANYPNHYTEVDFSEQGVEEMKRMVIHYGRDTAGIADGLDQTTFSSPIDMYLFVFNTGGFWHTIQPSYAMGVGAGRSTTYHYTEGVCPPGGELVRICYGRMDIDWEESAKYIRNGDIYVDPEDTDTLYLDFCGFWELERAEKEFDVIDMGCEPDLTEEEKIFLEEHVYGEWKFHNRLYGLYEDEVDNGINFSDQGVDELTSGKECYISYGESGGDIYYWQATLSRPEDVYLISFYVKDAKWKVWHVWGEVDAEDIRLRNVFQGKDDHVSLEGKDKLVEISGDNGYERSYFYGYYDGSHLYADPEDTETLYLDFCGLWELKRAD